MTILEYARDRLTEESTKLEKDECGEECDYEMYHTEPASKGFWVVLVGGNETSFAKLRRLQIPDVYRRRRKIR